MNTTQNRLQVERVFRNLANKCRAELGVLLTESDLKCQTYLELLRVPDFSMLEETPDHGVSSIPIHTETKFFDVNGRLREAPDLVITTPSRLSIRRRLDGNRQNTKGFHFDGSSILIELKFLRHQIPANQRSLQKIEHDIEKGQRLNGRRLDFHLFVVVFDRYGTNRNQVNNLFHHYRNQRNLTCLYFSLNMQP